MAVCQYRSVAGCLMAKRIPDDGEPYPFPYEKIAVALGQRITVYDELRDATDDIHPLDIADYLDYLDFDGRLMQSMKSRTMLTVSVFRRVML